MNLRLVTLNVGLVRIFGGWIEPAPYVEERLAALPGVLRDLRAPVIALQEIYQARHRAYLANELKDSHPYLGKSPDGGFWRLGGGLMVLSSFPMDFRFERFRAIVADEAIFADKGMLLCQLRLQGGRSLALINVHTTAGGAWHHPESAKTDRVRSHQIEQVLRAAAAEESNCLVAGDINAGPGVSEANFRQFENAGYDSLHDLLAGHDSGFTWDPLNPLNSGGPHRRCPPQRIDHLFAQRKALETRQVLPLSSSICCQEAVVATSNGKATISDHFGLCVDLELNLEGPA